MRRQAIHNLRAAIEANTERRTLDQLRAQGKSHVRVVSGEKVLQIIKAIVNDIVDREVGDATQRDRDRIVEETKRQFDRVLKLQTDQERLLREQKEIAEQYALKLETAQADYERAQRQIEKIRLEHAERETRMLGEYQERIRELTEKHGAASERVRQLEHEKERLSHLLDEEKRQAAEREGRARAEADKRLAALQQEQEGLIARLQEEKGALAGRQEQALEKARQRAEELEARGTADREARGAAEQRVRQLEQDLARAAAEAKEGAARHRDAEKDLHTLKARLETLEAARADDEREIERLQGELTAAREAAGRADAVHQLQGQLADMQKFLQLLDQKNSGANEATVSALLEQLSQREALDSAAMEERFSATLDASLDKITKTMEAATARPIDIVVEATDVLVDKIFDVPEEQISTNLAQLDVEQRTSKKGIRGTLEALRAMRAAQGAGEAPAAEKPADAGTKDKVKAAQERLKAVRKGEKK